MRGSYISKINAVIVVRGYETESQLFERTLHYETVLCTIV